MFLQSSPRPTITGNLFAGRRVFLSDMITFLLWCLLLVVCWPLALFALIVYPIVWLVLLPFRIVGVAVSGVLQLVWGIVTLPMALIRRLNGSHKRYA